MSNELARIVSVLRQCRMLYDGLGYFVALTGASLLALKVRSRSNFPESVEYPEPNTISSKRRQHPGVFDMCGVIRELIPQIHLVRWVRQNHTLVMLLIHSEQSVSKL